MSESDHYHLYIGYRHRNSDRARREDTGGFGMFVTEGKYRYESSSQAYRARDRLRAQLGRPILVHRCEWGPDDCPAPEPYDVDLRRDAGLNERDIRLQERKRAEAEAMP